MRNTERQLAQQKLLALAAQIDLKAEVALDTAIVPLPEAPITAPRNVFVTGGTGYLGAYVVAGLLARAGVHVFSLVRAKDAEAARQRQRAALEAYRLWDPAVAERLHVVQGDLGRPRLGLSEATYNELAEHAEVIYHVGAVVNLVFPYALLKPANVAGTTEVLRLATTGRSKWLHYVSTNGFFLTPAYAGRPVPEDDPAQDTSGLVHGYLQSKWVAEQQVLLARARGVPVSLYRPTFIGWDSRTGVYNGKDFMCALIDGCLALGAAPDLDLLVEVAAVDYVTQAILHLSAELGSLGKAFNVGNPARVPFREVVQSCRALGWPLTALSYPEWRSRLERARDNPAYGFRSMLPDLAAEGGATVGDALSSSRIPRLGFDHIQAALADSSIRCPPLDAALLEPHLAHLECVKQADSARPVPQFAPWGPR